jgi:hypothetical protein
MRHLDPADLAERALDEDAAPLASWQARHLRRCPACAGQLDGFRRVVNAARSVTADDVPVTPPRKVWDGLIADVAGEAREGTPSRTDEETPPARRKRAHRPRPSRPWAAAVAAVSLVLGASAGSAVTWWEMRQPAESVTAGTGQRLTSL